MNFESWGCLWVDAGRFTELMYNSLSPVSNTTNTCPGDWPALRKVLLFHIVENGKISGWCCTQKFAPARTDSFALVVKCSPAQTRLSHPSLYAQRGREEALRLFWLNAVRLQDESSELLGETNLCVKRSEPVLSICVQSSSICLRAAAQLNTIKPSKFLAISPCFICPRVQAASRQTS